MTTMADFSLPVLTVNGYLWNTIKQIESPAFAKKYGTKIPFFPLGDSNSGTKSWEDKTYVIYDRMLKMTNSPFYPIKKEHILYAVKGKAVDIFEWSTAIQYILDRQDDAAIDINKWNANQNNPADVYFHHLRVFQTGPTAARDFSNRPYYISEFIVEMEYHFTNSIEDFV